jgi:hypothetical protein
MPHWRLRNTSIVDIIDERKASQTLQRLRPVQGFARHEIQLMLKWRKPNHTDLSRLSQRSFSLIFSFDVFVVVLKTCQILVSSVTT